MSQAWGSVLWESMCQGQLDMLMTMMAEGQLKGMYDAKTCKNV